MNTSRMVVVRGSAVSVCLVLSACSSGTKSAVEKADPLTEFYGQQSPEKIAAMQAKAQKKTAECMRTQGFTYVPYSPPQSQMFTGPKPGQELEWKRKNGYGVSVSMESYGSNSAQGAADPNQTIQNKLSVSDQQAYQAALYGSMPKPGEETNFVPSGCMNAGYSGGNDKEIQALQMALQPKYDSLFKRIQADPRIAAVTAEWSGCLRKKGYEGIKKESDIYEKFLSPLQNKIYSSAPVPAVDAPPGPPKLDETKLAELRKVEFALANADADCSGKLITVQKTVNEEYQTKFLNENRASLEKIKAAQEA